MIRTLTFSLLIILLSTACKKEDLGFTNHAGNSTVSAKLNGKDWFASGIGGISYNRQDSFDTVFSVIEHGILKEVLSFIAIPMKQGQHVILDRMDRVTRDSLRPSYASFGTLLADGDVIGEWWDSTADTLHNYCIVDRVDTINKIIEGRFQLMLVKDPERDLFDTPDTLRFEDGKFSAEIRW